MRVHGNLNQMTARHRGTLHGASHRVPRSKKKHMVLSENFTTLMHYGFLMKLSA